MNQSSFKVMTVSTTSQNVYKKMLLFKSLRNSELVIVHLQQTIHLQHGLFRGQKAVRNSENISILRGK